MPKFTISLVIVALLIGTTTLHAAGRASGVPANIFDVVVKNWPNLLNVSVQNTEPIPVSVELEEVTVSGVVSISNLPETQAVMVENFPDSQSVTIENTSPIPVVIANETSATRPTYEYIKRYQATIETINSLGAEGWELTQVYDSNTRQGNAFIFMRQR